MKLFVGLALAVVCLFPSSAQAGGMCSVHCSKGGSAYFYVESFGDCIGAFTAVCQDQGGGFCYSGEGGGCFEV